MNINIFAPNIFLSSDKNLSANYCSHPQTKKVLPYLLKDTVSFTSMKKTQFEGVDYAVVTKFKAPIEKFNSNDDLQKWAGAQLFKLVQKDFGGRQKETQIQRKALLKEWADYVLKENDEYNNAAALLIFTALIEKLKSDNDKIPYVLNKGVLADCIDEIEKNIKNNKNYQFDLNKMYTTKLQAFYLDDEETNEIHTGWIIIPSQEHDFENFKGNVDKLKTLSYKSWCTKSFNAEPYLSKGDFHIYFENGKPKLGVRFIDEKIEEIQGQANDNKIPPAYLEIVEKHIEENGCMLSNKAQGEIEKAKIVKAEINKTKEDLKEAIASKDAKAIFEYFNMEPCEEGDGFFTISKFKQISDEYSYADIGIDENWFLSKIKHIIGDADFRNVNAQSMDNLETIGGNASFQCSKIASVPNLKTIGGKVYFNPVITNLNSLETIGANAYFEDAIIESIPKLKTIGGNADFQYSKIKNLNSLETIRGSANFQNSAIENIPNLETIGGSAIFEDCKIESIPNLKLIRADARFQNSKITNLNSLETIGGDADFKDTIIESIPNLKAIKWNADFQNSKIKYLNSLEIIRGSANFQNTIIESIPNLKVIGGDANFQNSKIKYLNSLETIGGNAYLPPEIENTIKFKDVKNSII